MNNNNKTLKLKINKILYKKVIDHNNVVMSHKKAHKKFYLSYEKIKNYKVINNSSKEL